MKNYFEDGIKYGEYISTCTNKLIVSLIAERARMYEEYVGIKESKEFIQGAVSAIKNIASLKEEIEEKNSNIRK